MSLFDTNSNVQAIPPGDLSMLTETLNVWCSLHRVPRSQATKEAKILIETYQKGKRSQADLVDALLKTAH
ncbi:hypothetical protein ASD31_09110 [Rhizobium sp. Root482]|nr:hypothetical protein ASD31_09110 [Rhizobium sp. Root482]